MSNFLHGLRINWKTTSAGATMIFGALADVTHQYATGMWDVGRLQADFTAIIGGIGLIAAQDGH